MIEIYALHGFLGLPNDWKVLFEECSSRISWHAVDILRGPVEGSMEQWATWFNGSLPKTKTNKRILLGYSMGGRLGLHVVRQAPSLWDGAVFVSTHPGLQTEPEKMQRQAADALWARRFEKEAWATLMQAWNGREIFKPEGFSFDRKESDYDRLVLAQLLEQWSLGRQECFRSWLKRALLPIAWIYGGEDKMYKGLAHELDFSHFDSRIIEIEKAAHRVPWEQPYAFFDLLKNFLGSPIQDNFTAISR